MEIVAAVATGAGKAFEMQKVRIDDPRGDEVLVRIVGVGVCHTDLVFKEGEAIAPPVVLGHEGAGVVEAVGANITKVTRGDRVVLTFRSCGTCSRCLRGDAAYCQTMPLLNYAGMRPDGSKSLSSGDQAVGSNFFGQSSFATYAITYERNVVKVPEDLPLELMGPLGCGVQTGVGGIMRSLKCERSSSLLITGAGPVGLSAVMGARLQGCSVVIVVEPHKVRRDLACEFGATHVVDPTAEPDLPAAVRRISPNGVNYAFETTGAPAVQAAALGALAPKGVLGLVGVAPPGSPSPGEANALVTYGHSIQGIVEGDSDPDTFLPELMEHHRKGELPFDRMITTFPFRDINKAVAAQHRGECIKIVLLMDDDAVGPNARRP